MDIFDALLPSPIKLLPERLFGSSQSSIFFLHCFPPCLQSYHKAEEFILKWESEKGAGFKIKTVLSDIQTFGINAIWFFMENAG